MSLQTVLNIVVDNSVLDLLTIDNTIRCLSREFCAIGNKAMVEHASFHHGLRKANSDFKFHYCTLCDKPHVVDGSWQEDLCDCRLDAAQHSREIQRRARLADVGDPRMDPSFAELSTKAKLLRLVAFTGDFSERIIFYVCGKGWLYRMSAMPLLQLGLPQMNQWNPAVCSLLSTCIYVDLIRKEFSKHSQHPTRLLDIGLQVLSAKDQSELDYYDQLLDDDGACMEIFLSRDDLEINQLCKAVFASFFDILFLSTQDGATLNDALMNLGNSIGTFLSDNGVNAVLGVQMIQSMLAQLPETFCWMPVYGGRREDYIPPVNRFARHASERNNRDASVAAESQGK